ncbi:MAG: lysine biosynthesis protein LysW [Gemmatimonadales bacterium]|nr:lysine biosynthesis protein LysW [Gemmatimonadales bacterium]
MPVSCPVCDAVVSLPADAVVSELLRCRDCGTELEIESLTPPKVREAPVAEEDWGQ